MSGEIKYNKAAFEAAENKLQSESSNLKSDLSDIGNLWSALFSAWDGLPEGLMEQGAKSLQMELANQIENTDSLKQDTIFSLAENERMDKNFAGSFAPNVCLSK